MKTEISKIFYFDMAHRLTFHDGLCRNIHGHGYILEVFMQGEPDEMGMIMDYGDLKDLVKRSITDLLDHSLAVYDHDELLMGLIPPEMKQVVFPFETTAENLASWILKELRRQEPGIWKVELRETRNNKAVCTI